MNYDPGLQAMLAAQRAAADAARRASIAAQQSQYLAQRKAKQQATQRVAASRPAPRPQIGTPRPPSGVYGQEDWIAVAGVIIAIIVIIAVF